ncbi:hypothetical protein [Lutibacter sp.]|uniref:hypothetical protein n=1 Tax=Lutibacter sp. TaxID=1925666 RepID=UPI0035667091
MKKAVLKILIIIIIFVSLSACKSSKKGCGLTSDAQKMEQSTSNKAIVNAEV